MIVATLLLATTLPLDTDDSIFRDGFDADACPAGRIEVSDLEYSDGTLTDVDVTSFDNLLGRFGVNYPPEPFPSVGGTVRILDFAMSGYIAARSSISWNTPDYYSGLFSYTNADVPDNPRIDFSISPSCADFSPLLGDCVAYGVEPQNGRLNYWAFVSNDGSPVCLLEIGRDYFFNIRIADPSTPSPACPNDVCAMRITSEVALP